MEPFDIKVLLLRKRVSQRSIAKKLGISTTAVSLVIHKRMVSNRIADAISAAIGLPKISLFPEYFDQKKQAVEHSSFIARGGFVCQRLRCEKKLTIVGGK